MTAKIFGELHNGKRLLETSTGAILNADRQEMELRHKREMQEMKKVVHAKDEGLQKELEKKHLEVVSKLNKL